MSTTSSKSLLSYNFSVQKTKGIFTRDLIELVGKRMLLHNLLFFQNNSNQKVSSIGTNSSLLSISLEMAI